MYILNTFKMLKTYLEELLKKISMN